MPSKESSRDTAENIQTWLSSFLKTWLIQLRSCKVSHLTRAGVVHGSEKSFRSCSIIGGKD